MRSRANRGISSRAVLLAAAIAAVGIVAAVLWSSDPDVVSRPDSPAERAVTSESDPRATLEGTGQSGLTRTDGPEAAAETSRDSLGTRKLFATGTVIDARSRAAVPDVEVLALVWNKQLRAAGRSDAAGRYAIELALPGDLPDDPEAWIARIVARGDRFELVEVPLRAADFRRDPTDPSAWSVARDIEIRLLLTLRGRLVREADGTPIPNGTATLLRMADPPAVPKPIGSVRSDDGGRFLLQTDEADPIALALLGAASGCLGKLVPVAPDLSQVVDVGDVVLGEGACIEGIVTTADGSRPAATEIFAHGRVAPSTRIFLDDGPWTFHDGSFLREHARVPIEADGTFSICGLAPQDYSLRLGYPGCRGRSSVPSVDVRAPASGVRVPVTEGVYRLLVLDAKTGERIPQARFTFDDPLGFVCWIEGDFVIALDPGSESSGSVSAEGYQKSKCTLPALVASEVRELEIRLEPLAVQIACTLVVKSPAGDPLPNIEIGMRSGGDESEAEGPMQRMSHHAPDGRHELPKLASGAYVVEVHPYRDATPGSELWVGTVLEIQVREGMEPIEVRLAEGGSVRASVTKADRTAVDARTWLIRTPGAEPEQLDWLDDATGHAYGGWIPKQSTPRLREPLPAGRWTIRFEAHECATRDVDIDIQPGVTAAIDVALAPKPR